jgi:hypothetical protein
MTDSHDDTGSTRPISVAELLAKNGTIGAPPVGGRRRRRRGNSDAVTVAELTGEIPIISEDAATTGRTQVQAHRGAQARRLEEVPSEASPEEPREEPIEESAGEPAEDSLEPLVEEPADESTEQPIEEPVEEPTEEPPAEPVEVHELVEEAESEPVLSAEEADYAAHLQQRENDPDPIDFAPPARRSQAAKSTGFAAQRSGAEQMSPDPVADDEDIEPDVDFTEALDEHSTTDDEAIPADDAPSYLRSSSGALFGGQSVADDLARRGSQPGPEDIDLGDTEVEPSRKGEDSAGHGGSAFVRGVWVVAQCVLAVAFGAGLFIAFDQLWRWNTIVALVLSVLVILGLVIGVRVVRKTEDIGSTLIAVAVGALVTLGPLALLQSH